MMQKKQNLKHERPDPGTCEILTGAIDYSLASPVARTEFLATYGALFIGLGAFMLYCCRNQIELGLICVLFTMGAMLFARGSGYALHGSGNLVQHIYVAGELVTVVLVPVLLRLIRRDTASA